MGVAAAHYLPPRSLGVMVFRNCGRPPRAGASIGCGGCSDTTVADPRGSGVAVCPGEAESIWPRLSSQDDHGVKNRMSTRRDRARSSGLGFSPAASDTLPMAIALTW